MSVASKLIAPAAVALLIFAASMIAPTHAQQPGAAGNAGETLLIDDATFEFIQKSDISPLADGVLEKMELEIGKTVEEHGVIGSLYQKKAEIVVRKAQLAAKSTGEIEKGEAQREQAMSVVARNMNLISRNSTYVTKEDQEKAKADVMVTEAMIKVAKENRALAQAEYDLAKNTLDEHTIKAPFSGVVMKVLKHPGESVKANEPVVELGNLDRLRLFAFVPLETSFRLSVGTEVEFQLTIRGKRGGLMPIEKKKFRGAISFIDPQIQPQVETEVRIYADFNNDTRELKPGMKGTLTLFLNAPGAAPVRRAAAKIASPAPLTEVAAPATGGLDLPALPR